MKAIRRPTASPHPVEALSISETQQSGIRFSNNRCRAIATKKIVAVERGCPSFGDLDFAGDHNGTKSGVVIDRLSVARCNDMSS
jgi:hypothetical protein